MLDNPNPCTPDCPDRTPTCHTDCEKYCLYSIFNIINRSLRENEQQLKNDWYCTSRHTKKQRKRRPYADNRYGC